MHTDPDTQLMLDFKAGDQRAFQNLFDRYKKRVINYCFRFCNHQEVAEELAQETFLKVYKAARGYRPKAKFSTWLYRIATNVCLNEIRKPVYRQRLESLDRVSETKVAGTDAMMENTETQRPDQLLVEREQQQVALKAIQRLPEKQRAALLLRIEGGFSYGEIGKQINRSENYVKTLIHRGRKQLKQALTPYFGERNGPSKPR